MEAALDESSDEDRSSNKDTLVDDTSFEYQPLCKIKPANYSHTDDQMINNCLVSNSNARNSRGSRARASHRLGDSQRTNVNYSTVLDIEPA
jgi:hypothetical protein